MSDVYLKCVSEIVLRPAHLGDLIGQFGRGFKVQMFAKRP